MGATTLTDRQPATWLARHAVRIALIALTLVLLAVAFVVGRDTADTSPAAPRATHVVEADPVPCHVGPC